jgi:hypothetical protein
MQRVAFPHGKCRTLLRFSGFRRNVGVTYNLVPDRPALTVIPTWRVFFFILASICVAPTAVSDKGLSRGSNWPSLAL